ncbi:MAG: amidohydrolase family protein [Pseudomonadales bacterium]
MKFSFTSMLWRLLLAFSLSGAANSYADFLIDNVSIVPTRVGESLNTSQAILIRNGSIQRIAAAGEIPVDEATKVIDGSGRYVMPGLIEMHAHIPVAEHGDDQLVRDTLFLFVSQGVTTIRGMIGSPYHLRLRREVNRRQMISPRIITSSPSLNGRTVRTEKSAIRLVKLYKQQGYDFLKIHPGISLPAMEALVSTAKEQSMVFSGHVPVAVGIEKALEYGYGTIDHLDGFVTGIAGGDIDASQGGFFGLRFATEASPDKLKSVIAMAADSGVAVVPTQTLFTRWAGADAASQLASEPEMRYMPRNTVKQWRERKRQLQDDPLFSTSQSLRLLELRKELLRAMDSAGIPIFLGSDAPQVFNVPGFSTLHELEAMVDAGLSKSVVLAAATHGPAAHLAALGGQNQLQYGEIKEGMAADLLLLNNNPANDISNIRSLRGVMLRGQWIDHDQIEQKLAEIAKRNR